MENFDIMIFRPSMEDMEDFTRYIKYMELKGAYKAGIVKVIPPNQWNPRKGGYNIDEMNIKIPIPLIQQVESNRRKRGIYSQISFRNKSMTLQQYRELAESKEYQIPKHFDYNVLEDIYWENKPFTQPAIYGADVEGSLMDDDLKQWNLNNLGTILDQVRGKIRGVNTPYLYFGMWKSSFCWHTEDMDLYSINYLHFGAPKTWYAIPPEYGDEFEKLANKLYDRNYNICNAHLRHKICLISPEVLKKHKISFNRITQEPNEFIITFPYGYHCGFNHGFNAAEAINFATERWIEYGKRAKLCECKFTKSVRISMSSFIERYQPEKYENWLLEEEDIENRPKQVENNGIINNDKM